ncbi:hypothetical protein DPMN_060762 [Dreissena polymorpha]|uniref:PH domain-containing protein n=1 Tax=Dreissena polymorpha TaxID=45954 RepID=A0A9D4HG97_DREPO|nr:hypothetical protein DPMN_060762 [Dreissena polymorpha]
MSFNDNDTETLLLPAGKQKSSMPYSNTEYEDDCDIGNLQSRPSPVHQQMHSGPTREDKGESILTCSGSHIVQHNGEIKSTKNPPKGATLTPMDFEDQDVELDVADSETCGATGKYNSCSSSNFHFCFAAKKGTEASQWASNIVRTLLQLNI